VAWEIPLARRQETSKARRCARAKRTRSRLGNLNQSRTPAWAPNTLHVGSSTSKRSDGSNWTSAYIRR
jgi:hypothetical protein